MSNNNFPGNNGVLRPDKPVGIVGYGAYIPRYRLPGTEGFASLDKWTGWFAN